MQYLKSMSQLSLCMDEILKSGIKKLFSQCYPKLTYLSVIILLLILKYINFGLMVILVSLINIEFFVK